MSGSARHALSPDQVWALTLGLLAVHQTEEVVYPIEAWLERVGSTGWPRLDAHVRGPSGTGNPLADARASRRLAVVGAQTLGAGALWATRVLATGLCLGGAAAFAMHIAVSVRTRSVMPGLATSLVPGLPGAALTLCAIWARA